MSVPWRLGQLLTLYLTSVAGVSLIVLSWYGTSGTAHLGTGVAWVNVGVVGVIVAGTGNALWLLHGHRAVRTRLRSLVAAHEPSAAVATPIDVRLVAVRGGRRAHLSTCPLVAGKTTRAARASLAPCEACLG